MSKKINILFLILGIFSMILSFFDIILEDDYFGATLAASWGLLFMYFAIKDILLQRFGSATCNVIKYVLVILVILSGILKMVHKLQLKGGMVHNLVDTFWGLGEHIG